MNRDQQLLQQYVTNGNQSAFREIVDRNGRMVFSACNRILNDAQLAEDATQEVFLLLAKNASDLNADVIIGGWLYKTASWTAIRM